MLRQAFALVTLLAVAACGSGDPDPVTAAAALSPGDDVRRSPVDPTAPVAELATGLNDAGFALWRTQPADANIVFSPVSIGHALLMARGAADATTGAAIDKAFGLPEGLAAHQAWNAIDQAIAASQSPEVTVTIGDRIWPDVTTRPDQEWIDLLASEHGADTETLDLSGDPEGSRQVINDWVSENTADLIPELLAPGFIEPGTPLVLTDTLYVNARWETPFGKYEPVNDAFSRLDGTTVDVEFMRSLGVNGRAGAGDGFVSAELPYAGDEYSMLVIVPDEGRFDEFRERLDADLLAQLDATLTARPYELLMPKWATHHEIDLLDWLSDVGAAPGAYPGISGDAFLDAAVHAADIEVDERGTVAAAATAVGFGESGPPTPELIVAADQPFLYLIRHRESGTVMFAGQVVDPA
ncbi:MAG TPA: serpin family protein [Jiangellaceae bacterium]